MLNPTVINQTLPRSNKTFHIVGISNKPQQVYVSEPVPFRLGPLRDKHCFFLSSSALTHLLGRDFLEKYAGISFSQKGEIKSLMVTVRITNQVNYTTSTSASFICAVSDGTVTESESTDRWSLLDQLPSFLWVKSSTNIGRIHSVPPVKVQIDPSKSLPRINIL